MVKNPSANAENITDAALIPESGRSPEGKHDNPLQCSCLENPHGQMSLAGRSLHGPKESDRTAAFSTHTGFSFPLHFLLTQVLSRAPHAEQFALISIYLHTASTVYLRSSQPSKSSHLPFPLGIGIFVLCFYVSVSVSQMRPSTEEWIKRM